MKKVLKTLARIWLCEILGDHTYCVHIKKDGKVILRCPRCRDEIDDKEILDEIFKAGGH